METYHQVLILEVADNNPIDPLWRTGQYRKDSPWLVDAFKKRGVDSDVIFIDRADSSDSLVNRFPHTVFLGRVNPKDYACITLKQYMDILNGLEQRGVLLGPMVSHMQRLGSKGVLYELRDSAMGIKDIRLHRYDDMMNDANMNELDRILPPDGAPRVLKTLHNSCGYGVWKLINKDPYTISTMDAYKQRITDLPRSNVLAAFHALCQEDAISMPFLPYITGGEFRFLVCKDKVVDIVHKNPISDISFSAALGMGAEYNILNGWDHKKMACAVQSWLQDLQCILDITHLPYWWSVDCIEADGFSDNQVPSCNPGRHLVLSEINCSCLGLVVDSSLNGHRKGMELADVIAESCLTTMKSK